ncbi:hypothetical protein [Butyrivibrio sp. JL13D10]|uniref:hypothetical protein n=1 Tax=Butyrivibrio sp. JL13D10 TaxID=3236815 RepID=UPI0038B45791
MGISFCLSFFGRMFFELYGRDISDFFIGDLIHVDVRPLMDHLMFPIMFVLPFIDLFWDVIKWGGSRIKLSKKRKKRKRINFISAARSFFSDIRSDSEKWFIFTFGITPHLDKYIGLKERIKVISGMKFRPYKHRLEGKVRFLKVSEDDKWVKILGKYFPLDLICGYNNETNQLFFIDGYVVKLPAKAMDSNINRCIEDFFNERGYTYNNLPSGARKRFDKLVGDRIDQFECIDWSGLRHEWEVATANYVEQRKANKNSNDRYRPVSHSGKLNRDFLSRALSERELKLTAEIFKGTMFSLSELTCFSAYQNEYSVCNGVYILGELKYPANKKGLDFLFDCLSDVDEAYFMPAAGVLSEVPLTVLAPIMEKKSQEAYLKCDVMRLAGIMYLAKETGYEIQFVKNLKEQLAGSASVPMTEIDENGVVCFAPEEDKQYMTKEAVAFKATP